MSYEEFLNLIKMRRLELNLTQEDLAYMIPVSRIRYNRIETNKSELTYYELKAIAEILNINLNVIKNKKPKDIVSFD